MRLYFFWHVALQKPGVRNENRSRVVGVGCEGRCGNWGGYEVSIRTSEDFKEGQKVSCPRPEVFLSEKRRYLTGREGIVIEIAPARISRDERDKYVGRINQVYVEWQKRGNRGKVQRMWMLPIDIELLNPTNGTQTPSR